MSNPVTRVETIAKAGFLARGIVYILLGYFAFTTRNVVDEGTGGVLEQIYDVPGGTILLILVAVGLAAYGFFRLYSAIVNLEPASEGWKAPLKRIGQAISGIAHFVLAVTAVQLALYSNGQSDGEQGQQEAAKTLLSLPLGGVLLAIVAAGFFFAAFEQAVKAWSGKFMHKLDADAPAAAEYVGRIGYGARSVVFILIGFALVRGALQGSAREVQGIGGVLTDLSGMGIVYTAVALGLGLFGVFSLVMAKYRRICDEDVIERLKSLKFA